MNRVFNFRIAQKNLKAEYYNVKIGDEKIRIYIKIDRGGRVIDCTRIGDLFNRLNGRQFLSWNGINEVIGDIVYDEVDRINFGQRH